MRMTSMHGTTLMARAGSVAAAVSVAVSLASSAALAQEATAEKSEGLEEIVVTAQFRSERLHDAPLAISAISAESLEARGATDIIGGANQIPNVNLSPGAAGFGQMASIFIRGVGQADPHFAVEPGVGIYIDDTYYGVMTGAVLQLLDVDRVEVLRGPQGTLSGKNSIGGSVKLFTKRPGPGNDGFVEATYGKFNRIEGRAAGNITLLDDKLFLRVSVAGKNVDGYVSRLDYGCVTGDVTSNRSIGSGCKVGTEGGERLWTGRASLLWKITDSVENLLIADATRDTSEDPATKQIFQSPLWAGTANYITGPGNYTNYENRLARPTNPGVRNQPFAMPDITPLTARGISNTLTADLGGGLELKSLSSFRQSETQFSTPLEASPASILDQIWRLKHKQYTQELRLSGTQGKLLDWTVGLFYYRADGMSTGRIVIPGGLALGGGGLPFDLRLLDPVNTRSKSAFAYTAWHMTDQLSLTAAARYTDDSKEFTFNRLDLAGAPYALLPGLYNLPVKFAANRFDYRAGLNFKFTDSLMAYGQVSTGFKGGGVNPRPFFSTQALTFEPETLTAYEAGLKTEFFDRHVTANVAVFRNKYKDFQGTVLSCPALSPTPTSPCTQTTNVGNATIDGAELETAVRTSGGLEFNASVGVLDFQYSSINAATGITRSMKNVYMPEFTASAGVAYEINMGDLGSLTPRVDYSFRSEMFTDVVNTNFTRISPRGIADAKLIWNDAKGLYGATLAVTNLTDKFYYDSYNIRAAVPYLSGTGRPGRPREWRLSVRRNFE